MFEGWDLAEVCRFVRAVGFEGIELAPFTLAPLITDLTPDRRRAILAAIADAGLTTIGLHWLLAKTEGFYLTSPDPEVQRRTGAYLAELARAARDLGGDVLVLGSPLQRNLLPGVSYEQALDFATATLEPALPILDEVGVDLALEPLGPGETDFLNTCAQALAWIERIGHPRVQLHLDVKAQSTEADATVPELFARHGGTARHCHVQDTNRLGPGMGEVDFGPILQSLVGSGYYGWASVEVFDFTPGPERIARESFACLKRTLDAARSE